MDALYFRSYDTIMFDEKCFSIFSTLLVFTSILWGQYAASTLIMEVLYLTFKRNIKVQISLINDCKLNLSFPSVYMDILILFTWRPCIFEVMIPTDKTLP